MPDGDRALVPRSPRSNNRRDLRPRLGTRLVSAGARALVLRSPPFASVARVCFCIAQCCARPAMTAFVLACEYKTKRRSVFPHIRPTNKQQHLTFFWSRVALRAYGLQLNPKQGCCVSLGRMPRCRFFFWYKSLVPAWCPLVHNG